MYFICIKITLYPTKYFLCRHILFSQKIIITKKYLLDSIGEKTFDKLFCLKATRKLIRGTEIKNWNRYKFRCKKNVKFKYLENTTKSGLTFFVNIRVI